MDPKTVKLLEDIKKLLILQLVRGNTPVSTDDIGKTLGVTGRAIRNIASSETRK